MVNPSGVPEEGPGEHVGNALMLLVNIGERKQRASGTWVRIVAEKDYDAVVRRLQTALRQLRSGEAGGSFPRPMGVPRLPNPGRKMATAVYEIAYRHADDGKDYQHTFQHPEQVSVQVLDPRRVLLCGGREPIIQMFEVED
jgi:hypothetical protein